MKATFPDPRFVTRDGKAVSVIISVRNYGEFFEGARAAGEIAPEN